MKKLFAKSAKKTTPTPRQRQRQAPEKPEEPDVIDEPEDDQDEEQEEEDDEEEVAMNGEQQQTSGGGDEKEIVLGHMTETKVDFHLLPREKVREILVAEADAQEKYEDQDYDRRAKATEENAKKAEEAMATHYDPDKLREDAKKLNETKTDPNKAAQQAKEIQELRKKLYPQPFIKGGGGD
jgi:hypothetical protein